jgi:MFS family permease
VRHRLTLPANDLLRDAAYRRLFASVIFSSFGGQITLLALPLTAALLLQATPTQMGLLTAMESAPFILLSLPAGVWLDRVRKLPVYIGGELCLGLAVASVPLAYMLGWLTMPWLYVVGLLIGTVSTVAGSASQVVLRQVVPRERLVEAYSKYTLASSAAEVVGPGVAGVLIKLLGAPITLLTDALMLLMSAVILRGIHTREAPPERTESNFWRDLKEGALFVRGQPLLMALAWTMGGWQFCLNAATVVQIIHATRNLGLSEQAVGLCYAGLGLGTVVSSALSDRISARWGSGPTLVVGVGLCGAGWLTGGLVSQGPAGVAAFGLMLVVYGLGSVLAYVNFLALRQAATPEALQGRMTSTMRWLVLLPAGPGALLGGWLGDRAGLNATLVAVGVIGLSISALAWRSKTLRSAREMPEPEIDTHAPDTRPAPT